MENELTASDRSAAEHDTFEMLRPTPAPLVLSVGLALMAAGMATNVGFAVIGGVLCLAGLGAWIANLLPGRGHFDEALAAPASWPEPTAGVLGRVASLRAGMPGYRMQLPEKVHPISAGVKGGLVGGLVMPLPALAYGVFSGHGIWYPVNLLAAVVVPGMDQRTTKQLEPFQVGLVAVALVVHAAMSLVLGMIYGVLLPTLPKIPTTLAWGALLAPMLWTGASYVLMGAVNPALQQGVDWPWFIASQFVFGAVLAGVVMCAGDRHPTKAGVFGALVGGVVMLLPALVWSVLSGHGVWYPANLLAGMVIPTLDRLPFEELTKFHPAWLLAAVFVHAGVSLSFGVLFAILLPRLPSIPAPVAWGAMLLPLVWTSFSYAMMGVANPLLAERVDWPWFVVSQLVFGLAAATVVVRTEMIPVPPAGSGSGRAVGYDGQQ